MGSKARQVMLYALALVALVGAGAAYTAASPSAKLKKQDNVYGGGQVGVDVFPTVTSATPSRTMERA